MNFLLISRSNFRLSKLLVSALTLLFQLAYLQIKFKIWSVLLLMKRSKGAVGILSAQTNLKGTDEISLNFIVRYWTTIDDDKFLLSEIFFCLINAHGIGACLTVALLWSSKFQIGISQGLKINLHKSKLMGIGVSSNVVAAAASLIGCSILTAPFNYLGVKIGRKNVKN
ncbi:hypothetical protein Tco_0962931 [Tanacetum coccineum]